MFCQYIVDNNQVKTGLKEGLFCRIVGEAFLFFTAIPAESRVYLFRRKKGPESLILVIVPQS